MQGLLRPAGGYAPFPHLAAQHLRHFKVYEVRSMQALAARINSSFDALSRRRPEEPFHRDRCVENDQRPSRSSRRMRTVSMSAVTGSRRRNISRNSARVGCSAISRIGQQIVRERHPCHGGTGLQAAAQGIGHIADLNHLGHVLSAVACAAHVNGESASRFQARRNCPTVLPQSSSTPLARSDRSCPRCNRRPHAPAFRAPLSPGSWTAGQQDWRPENQMSR
jgi:hypothetical protein